MRLIINADEWEKIDELLLPNDSANFYKNDRGTILLEIADEFYTTYSYWDVTDSKNPYYLGSTESGEIDTGIDGGSSFAIDFYGNGEGLKIKEEIKKCIQQKLSNKS